MYRWLFIAVTVLWLVAMTALIRRDVWPAWTAQEAPRMEASLFGKPGDVRREQFGILDADDERIGTAWGEVQVGDNGRASVTGVILVDGLTLIPPVRVESNTEFDDHGELDSFHLDVYGVPMTVISVQGERRGIYFPCEMQIGPVHRQTNLEVSASRMIGESLRPFAVLPKLHVGQSWRMQILDPLSAMQGGRKAEFKSVVAEVTGKEAITTEETGKVECFVVEVRGQRAKAWVAPDGRVLRQEVAVPGVKKLTLQAEEYRKERRDEAAKRVRSTQIREKGQHGHRD
jgi:hypothetical protein